ncbi:MAG: hypothetical protein M1823_005054 [Watsoniomyces obsoletus]|nr:MAG: hypothetical protein M1823_005054 [Watsoniomyces obsoletus]
MGVGPPLPAPTEPSSLSSANEAAPGVGSALGSTDQATDVSNRTDRTSYSIPEDGSPITISTRRKRGDREGRDSHGSRPTRPTHHHSQTSLLIEYFEAGKVQSRPSVRVKVTPSAARKIKATNEQIHITETVAGSRQPSYTKRIALTPSKAGKGEALFSDSADDRSSGSVTSVGEDAENESRPALLPAPPIEVEVMGHQDDASSVSNATSPRDSRYIKPNASEISAMPPDSFLDPPPLKQKSAPRRRVRSRSLERREIDNEDDEETSGAHLKAPARRRSRSLSRDRITAKVIEKLEHKAIEAGTAPPKRHTKSRSRSVSKELLDPPRSSHRRRSGKTHREEDALSGGESARLTTSALSPSRKSGDQYSFRSGTSQSSLNNPRLLATVEDAIKRLILPELSALKHEQKTQKNRSRFDESTRESNASGSIASRDGSRRRVSKVSSAPDVKPRVSLVPDDGSGRVVAPPRSGDSVQRRKERKSSREMLESPSEKSSGRRLSEETLTEGRVRGKRSKDRASVKDGKDAAGQLTAAALRHHDSKSSIDRHERRSKRRSKSRSRSASIDELGSPIVEEVPPIPFSSEVNGSEVTRESILTARTDLQVSPEVRTRHGQVVESMGAHHSNDARDDLVLPSTRADGTGSGAGFVARAIEAGLTAAAAEGPTVPRSYERQDQFEPEHILRHRRSLSPIQSVASYKEDSSHEQDRRDSFLHTQSADSLSSLGRQSPVKPSAVSLESVSVSASTPGAQSRRKHESAYDQRYSLETEGARRDSEYLSEEVTPRGSTRNQGGERLRLAPSNEEPTVDLKRMTNYTEDSTDGSYLHKMAAGQEVLGVGHNPEYRHTPVAVSSAVASLHNASVVDVRSTRSGVSKAGDGSLGGSVNEGSADAERVYPIQRRSPAKRKPAVTPNGVSPLANSISRNSKEGSLNKRSDRSLAASEERVVLGASGLPVADDPLPEIGHGLEDESEVTTNPSIIQGPIGGIVHGDRDHWPYDPTPEQPNGRFLDGHATPDDRDLHVDDADHPRTATGVGLGADIGGRQLDVNGDYPYGDEVKASYRNAADDGYTDGVNHDFGVRRDSYPHDGIQATPLKDEGYISAANPRSPAAVTPEYHRDRADPYGDEPLGDMMMGQDDPFTSTNHARHLSVNSHGMASPLYDSAMGRGLDRIESKDIVALMDHLTVRDAQRNARDTEILVTLVRSAAEMRNSFEDMKKLLVESEMNIIESTDKNTERSVQKVINGPRPQPLGPPRQPRRAMTEDDTLEDLPTKRRNVFRRALKGLSMRSSNDLSKIEDMLVQLLGDVEGLKAAQEPRASGTHTNNSLHSYENLQASREGYEPEGQAGTGSTNQSHSGYFSNPPSRQASAMRSMDAGRAHDHRISTVPEADEELAGHEEGEEETVETPYEAERQFLSPPVEQRVRGASVPLDSPTQEAAMPATTARSTENSPKVEKAKKHKSTASSIFPRISRWSETTASTVARQFRGSSSRKDREYSEAASRSGSEVDMWQYRHQEEDQLRGSYSLESDVGGRDSRRGSRPASPLVPPPATQEDPKYQAHRDSRNLQHPQPRQGPTDRYQYHLEHQAQNFDSPISPTSEPWASNPNLTRFAGNVGAAGGSRGTAADVRGAGAGIGGGDQRGPTGHLSPLSSDAGYSQTSVRDMVPGPPRPPKISTADDEPLVPQRPPKIVANRYSNGSGSSHVSH